MNNKKEILEEKETNNQNNKSTEENQPVTNLDDIFDLKEEKQEEKIPTKLKAVSCVEDPGKKGTNNRYGPGKAKQEKEVIQAFIATDGNMKETRDLTELKTTTQVERIISKAFDRKEFRNSLAKHNISWDRIAGVIDQALSNPSYKAQLAAAKMVMTSAGIDKHEDDITVGNGWEDVVQAYARGLEVGAIQKPQVVYEVKQPVIPDDVKQRQEEEKKLGQELYGDKEREKREAK